MTEKLFIKNFFKKLLNKWQIDEDCINFVQAKIATKKLKKMKGNHFELEDALRNIVGIWHDPLTKDAYRFTAEEDGGRAEVFILQQALGTPLSFKYQITKDEAGVWLSIDGNKMKILQLTSYPQPVLSFQSANNTISLFKNDSSAIEDLNFTKG